MVENTSRKRLGRGLAALIGDIEMPDSPAPQAIAQHVAPPMPAPAPSAAQAAPQPAAPVSAAPISGAATEKYLPIDRITRNPQNPRRSFSDAEIADLAQSIREHGIVQPVLVRPSPERQGFYELIAGERRWRAAQAAGLERVPVILRDVDDRTALELAIIENVQRADLNPVEEAQGYKQLIDGHGYSQEDLAQIIGKSRSHLANMMRLLKLPDDVLELLSAGKLTIGHARCLINTENPSELAKVIVSRGLSVRQAETLAARGGGAVPKQKLTSEEEKAKDETTKVLENSLVKCLGFPVAINLKNNGCGDIRIPYKSFDELEAICRRIGSNLH